MSVKASISISEQQDRYARGLVAEGKFSSLSAVIQHALEEMRAETERREAELAALRALLEDRAEGEFVSIKKGRAATAAMIAKKKAAHGV